MTGGLITELLSSSDISGDTMLVITNVVYFKSKETFNILSSVRLMSGFSLPDMGNNVTN